MAMLPEKSIVDDRIPVGAKQRTSGRATYSKSHTGECLKYRHSQHRFEIPLCGIVVVSALRNS